MEKEKLREIVKKSVEEVWFNRRSMNPVADQTEFLTEALHQALSMSGVVESADSPSINNEGTHLLDEYGKKICNCVDPNRTYFPGGAIVCMNCWGEWYH